MGPCCYPNKNGEVDSRWRCPLRNSQGRNPWDRFRCQAASSPGEGPLPRALCPGKASDHLDRDGPALPASPQAVTTQRCYSRTQKHGALNYGACFGGNFRIQKRCLLFQGTSEGPACPVVVNPDTAGFTEPVPRPWCVAVVLMT